MKENESLWAGDEQAARIAERELKQKWNELGRCSQFVGRVRVSIMALMEVEEEAGNNGLV